MEELERKVIEMQQMHDKNYEVLMKCNAAKRAEYIAPREIKAHHRDEINAEA